MKYTTLLILALLSTFLSAQVPVKPSPSIEASPPNKEEYNDVASYYSQNGKYGIIYPRGVKQEAIYDKVKSGVNGLIVKQGDFYGITDEKGVLMGKMEYDAVTVLNQCYLISKNNKNGLLSKDGNVLLPIKYDKIFGRNNYMTLVQKKDGKTQLIFNKNGKTSSKKIEFANMYPNWTILKVNGQFGVMTDEVIVPFEFDSIGHHIDLGKMNQKRNSNSNIITVNLNRSSVFDLMTLKEKKLGLVDRNGKEIYPPENDAIVRKKMLSHYTIKKGNTYSIYFNSYDKKTGFDFSRVYTDGVGYIMAVKDNLSGAFNVKGEEVVPFIYDAGSIRQNSAAGFYVKKNKKHGIVDKTGAVVLPAIYEEISSLYTMGFSNFLKLTSDGKSGIINLKGDVIIPAKFDWIGTMDVFFKVMTSETDKKYGLYDMEGKVILPAEYSWIRKSDYEKSRVLILEKDSSSYNFMNSKFDLVFKENIIELGYVHDGYNYLNPHSPNGVVLMYVKNAQGKVGMFNELTATLDIPMDYDEIIQHFGENNHNYYIVKNGKKFGLINEKNEIILPVEYEDIRVDMLGIDYDKEPQIVVAKEGEYGTLDLNGNVKIPFKYADLKCISRIGLFKAKIEGSKYQIINSDNKPITTAVFDDIANFEKVENDRNSWPKTYEALTFKDGEMCIINNKGEFVSSKYPMEIHDGYATFIELKENLVRALDSNDNELLRDFANKIAPSEHIQYFLYENIFTGKELKYFDETQIKEKYYRNLLKFKNVYWESRNGQGYERRILTEHRDYTSYRDGYITNSNFSHPAYGDTKYLEKILRNSIKVNGFWISTYFMKRYF